MEKYVVSRELAEKLKAAGYPQKSPLFHWFGGEVWDRNWQSYGTSEAIAAPLSDELLEQLPTGCHVAKNKLWYVAISNGSMPHTFTADKPADALAELWLYCKEHGYIGAPSSDKEAV